MTLPPVRRIMVGVGLVLASALALSACSTAPISSPSGSTSTTATVAASVALGASGDLGNGWKPDHALALQYATGFSVDFYQDDIALIAINEGDATKRYILVPESVDTPKGIASDITVLRQPLASIYDASTPSVSMFAALDALDVISYGPQEADAWHIPAIKAQMTSGKMAYPGKYSAPDYEMLVKDKPDLALENSMILQAPEVREKLESLGVPVLMERFSYENHPLGRVEWIKLLGLLSGKLGKAEEVFADQIAKFEAVSDLGATGKTVVFFYINSNGGVTAWKASDYFSQMITMAGGDYGFTETGDDPAAATVKLEMEQFYALVKDADYIIYNGALGQPPTQLSQFTDLNPLLKDFQATQTGQVWTTTKVYYQDSADLATMMTDIRAMLTWSDGADDQLKFLRRLS
ncbi:MAG: ABC transporter substrate-binding protein [Propionibacteriaceae bacterium]|nr:ABC transporter substrate-binding protein [Propionibacteriaceae bacterium]